MVLGVSRGHDMKDRCDLCGDLRDDDQLVESPYNAAHFQPPQLACLECVEEIERQAKDD